MNDSIIMLKWILAYVGFVSITFCVTRLGWQTWRPASWWDTVWNPRMICLWCIIFSLASLSSQNESKAKLSSILIPSGNEPGTNQSPLQIVSYLFDRFVTEICFPSTYGRISPAGFFTPDRLSLMKTCSCLLWISTAGKYLSQNMTVVRKR